MADLGDAEKYFYFMFQVARNLNHLPHNLHVFDHSVQHLFVSDRTYAP